MEKIERILILKFATLTRKTKRRNRGKQIVSFEANLLDRLGELIIYFERTFSRDLLRNVISHPAKGSFHSTDHVCILVQR